MVDCVIVAESLYSHRGKEKHAFLREATMNKEGPYQVPWLNASRFQFKLVSVVDDINMLSENNLWGQEYQSRRIIEGMCFHGILRKFPTKNSCIWRILSEIKPSHTIFHLFLEHGRTF
jgi:hypothetical protein